MANTIEYRVNEFTGLTSYFCGDASMTALHNHTPHNGNWVYVVSLKGEGWRQFTGPNALKDGLAHLETIGNPQPATWDVSQLWEGLI